MDRIQSDPEAETIILAYCLMAENLEPLADLEEEHFASNYNRLIVRCLKQLTDQGKTWNLASVAAELADRRNGNQIPASYVAGLTDGVPLSMHNLEPQRERLREFARRHQAMAQADLLRGQLERGASLGDVTPAAIEILERVKPNARAAEKLFATEAPCPAPPDTAWAPLARLYREAIGATTEAPDNYHLACFLTAIGTTLGRSVYNVDASSEPLYTNLFTNLVGTAGDPRKGTAMAKATRLGREILPNLAVIKSVDSAEGLIGAFLKFQGPEVVGFSPVIIRFTELRSLLDKAAREGARNIMPKLCDIYDGEDLEKNTVEPIRVQNPFGSFLAGTSLAYMKGLKREDIEGGLGSRLQFIPGVPKPRKAKTPPPREPEYTNLVQGLRGVLEFWRERKSTAIGLSEEAWEMWEPFYEDLPNRVREEPMIAALAARHHHHTLKTALIYAALDRCLQIEGRHLASAILWQNFLLDSLYYVFSDFGIPVWVDEERRIVAAVQSAPNGVISRRKLQQRFGG